MRYQSINQSTNQPLNRSIKSISHSEIHKNSPLWKSITAMQMTHLSTSVIATAVEERYFVPAEVREIRKKRIIDVVCRSSVMRLVYFIALEVVAEPARGAALPKNGFPSGPSMFIRLILPREKDVCLPIDNPGSFLCSVKMSDSCRNVSLFPASPYQFTWNDKQHTPTCIYSTDWRKNGLHCAEKIRRVVKRDAK